MIFQEGLAAAAESEELEVAPQAGVTANRNKPKTLPVDVRTTLVRVDFYTTHFLRRQEKKLPTKIGSSSG